MASDDELLAGVAARDRAALGSLYERYSKRLHDFARRTVRDPDAAADVVQNTFLKIWRHLERHRPPEHARAWIYTIARNEAIDEVRRGARARPVGAAGDDLVFWQVDPAPERSLDDLVVDQEFAKLVWSAASALNPRAYTLLDMHLRQDLTLDEMASALGIDHQNLYKQMSRMREALGEAVSDLLLIERRTECPELDDLIERLDLGDELTPSQRRALTKHVRRCDECRETRRAATVPAAVFARLAPVPIPAVLAAGDAGDVLDAPPARGSSVGSASRVGVAGSVARRSPLVTGAGVVAGLVVVGIAAIAIAGSRDSPVAADPDDVASITHEIGVASTRREITVAWTPVPDSAGYSVAWTVQPDTLPNRDRDLDGSAARATSPRLDDGEWYFHLRTENAGGEWTSTVHLGPFVIGEPLDRAPASSTAASSATSTPSTTSSPSSPTTLAEAPDVAGTYVYEMSYSDPTGGCGYPAFTDTVELTLHEDGRAELAQAQHLSVGQWDVEGGVLRIDLVLETEFPETYALASDDLGATVGGQSTYQDGNGCVTTYQITAVGAG